MWGKTLPSFCCFLFLLISNYDGVLTFKIPDVDLEIFRDSGFEVSIPGEYNISSKVISELIFRK